MLLKWSKKRCIQKTMVLIWCASVLFILHFWWNIPDDPQHIRMRLLTAKDYNSAEGLPVRVGQDVSNWRHLSVEEVNELSALGRRLFLEQNVTANPESWKKNFTIAVWKHGPSLERRFLRHYGNIVLDPFQNCSVSNCQLRYEDSSVKTADAVLFHLHKTTGPNSLPTWRSPRQRWIFLTDENPANTFILTKKYRLWDYNGLFNWSMHFRMDADVPVPYGRTIQLTKEELGRVEPHKNYARQKTKMVAVMGSNCGGSNKRWSYVQELQHHVAVDTYGGCGKIKCAGHFTSDCPQLNQYKFYLAFENGDCKQYITEKVWWNGFQKESVPVVMGAKREDYEKLLPPDSFIHVDDYDTPKELAHYLLFLNQSDEHYNKYFRWKMNFKIVNEHGYFKTSVFHYCRICEALNYNDPSSKVYRNLEAYWNPKVHCYPPKWTERLKKRSGAL